MSNSRKMQKDARKPKLKQKYNTSDMWLSKLDKLGLSDHSSIIYYFFLYLLFLLVDQTYQQKEIDKSVKRK